MKKTQLNIKILEAKNKSLFSKIRQFVKDYKLNKKKCKIYKKYIIVADKIVNLLFFVITLIYVILNSTLEKE